MNYRDTVLVADSDRNTANLLESVLKTNQYDVLIAGSGAEALTLAASHCPDLIIMDLSLPDIDGIELLTKIREWSPVPILILSARNRERDKVSALDSGADDYITKPFGVSELLARLRLARRHRLPGNDSWREMQNGELVIGDLVIDYNKHRVLKHGRDAGLTQTEFRIMALLGRHIGRLVTYDMILKEIWGPNSSRDTGILRVNMANIRRKTEKNPAEPDYIFTEAGVGYYLKENERE